MGRQGDNMFLSNHCQFRIVSGIAAMIAALAPLGAVPRPPFELRDNAPEQLVVEVVSVKVDHDSTALVVAAQAKIIDVAKSKGGLKAGQLISIVYKTYPQTRGSGTCSTPQMLVLIKSRQYKVFLTNVSNGTFTPAADWLSFEGLERVP
jgi:hypothetical protein